MPSSNFDTLAYAKKLQEAGFTPQQAEAQASALRAVVEDNLATKRDIEEVRREIAEVRREVELLRVELKRDLEELGLNMEHRFELVRRDIEGVRRDIILWLGGIIVTATTVLGVLMKLL